MNKKLIDYFDQLNLKVAQTLEPQEGHISILIFKNKKNDKNVIEFRTHISCNIVQAYLALEEIKADIIQQVKEKGEYHTFMLKLKQALENGKPKN